MYSILIRDAAAESFTYYMAGSEKWTGTLAQAKAKVAELLNTYTLPRLTVVHNATIDLSTLTITDVSDD